MLIMRSDFIGDCARFHGLPEAVSAAQFLVPSFTRDQLGQVICRPIEQAGASIDPELVERLLNDCSTEMDQLPVLQHCLSRLWEEAGKMPAAAVAPTIVGQSRRETGAGQRPARHLSLNHYNDIGGYSDALSRHADEILKELPGPILQLAVEQVFSALSNLDKEGREIRRPLQFSRLVAETGVDETAVRKVLDRFRADDCSFLRPPPLDVNVIEKNTLIDVGHEALLRRWEKVSDRGAALGWLRAEQQAGERYRALLAMAEGENAELPAHLADERLAWWSARPRTAEWAERYGGGFASVQRLLRRSQRRRTLRRWRNAAAFAAVAAAALAMLLLWLSAVVAEKETQLARIEAEQRRLETLATIKTFVERLPGFMGDGTLRLAGVRFFLEYASETLTQLSKEGDRSLEISKIEISLLNAISDVEDNLEDHGGAEELAKKAERLSDDLAKQYPGQPDLELKRYQSKFRVGDQLARFQRNATKAEEKYDEAYKIIERLSLRDPDNVEYQRAVVFAGNKLGDMQQCCGRSNWQAALDKYNAGLEILEKVRKKPLSPDVMREATLEVAVQKARIAQALSQRGQPGDHDAAVKQYQAALSIQERLLESYPTNATLLGNTALTYRRLAGLLKDTPDQAQLQYEKAVATRRKLYEGDPGNMTWRIGLVADYTSLGDVLMQREKWREASQTYVRQFEQRKGLP